MVLGVAMRRRVVIRVVWKEWCFSRDQRNFCSSRIFCSHLRCGIEVVIGSSAK